MSKSSLDLPPKPSIPPSSHPKARCQSIAIAITPPSSRPGPANNMNIQNHVERTTHHIKSGLLFDAAAPTDRSMFGMHWQNAMLKLRTRCSTLKPIMHCQAMTLHRTVHRESSCCHSSSPRGDLASPGHCTRNRHHRSATEITWAFIALPAYWATL